MTCRELIEFLMDYLDGVLADDQRQRFDRHLAVCPACVEFMKSYQRMINLEVEALREPGATELPQLPQGLINAILAAREKEGR